MRESTRCHVEKLEGQLFFLALVVIVWWETHRGVPHLPQRDGAGTFMENLYPPSTLWAGGPEAGRPQEAAGKWGGAMLGVPSPQNKDAPKALERGIKVILIRQG